jgi:uncharacterized protein (DUF305 family)
MKCETTMRQQSNTSASATEHSARRFSWRVAILAILALTAVCAYADGPAPDPVQAALEVSYMTNTINRHAFTIEAAELCQRKAIHGRLRQRCANAILQSSRRIAQLQSFLLEWYGIEHEPALTEAEEARLERLAALRGAAFEISYMQMTIRRDSAEILQAAECVQGAFHFELATFCDRLISAHRQEILQLRILLCKFYDICFSSRGPRDSRDSDLREGADDARSPDDDRSADADRDEDSSRSIEGVR